MFCDKCGMDITKIISTGVCPTCGNILVGREEYQQQPESQSQPQTVYPQQLNNQQFVGQPAVQNISQQPATVYPQQLNSINQPQQQFNAQTVPLYGQPFYSEQELSNSEKTVLKFGIVGAAVSNAASAVDTAVGNAIENTLETYSDYVDALPFMIILLVLLSAAAVVSLVFSILAVSKAGRYKRLAGKLKPRVTVGMILGIIGLVSSAGFFVNMIMGLVAGSLI